MILSTKRPNTGVLLPRSRRTFRSPLPCLYTGDCPRRIQTSADLERRSVPGPAIQAVSAVTTPLFTLGDKFRILGEPFRAKGTIRMSLSGIGSPPAWVNHSCTMR
ncbi:MAG: hypothetical protein V8T12_10490 [Parabacteroides johnsonii]